MERRIEVAKDIAQIGIWDESLGGHVLPKMTYKKLQERLAADAEAGRLFLLQLGAWMRAPPTAIPRRRWLIGCW